MLKRARWILLAIFAVALVAMAVAITNAERYLKSQRELIQTTLSRVLDRETSFEDIELSLIPLGIRLTHPRVEEEPGVSEEAFITAQALELEIDPLAALFGRIELDGLLLESPITRIVRVGDGWNFESLGGSKPMPEDPEQAEARESLLSISGLDVRDGDLRYIDATRDVDLDLRASQLHIEAEAWSPGSPLRFEARAALFEGESQNAALAATIRPKTGSEATSLDLALRLDSVDAKKLIEQENVRRLLPQELQATGPLNAELRLTGPLRDLVFEALLELSALTIRHAPVERLPGESLELRLRASLTDAAADFGVIELMGKSLGITGRARLEHSRPPRLDFSARSTRLLLETIGLADTPRSVEGSDAERLEDLEVSGRLTFAEAGPSGPIRLTSSRGLLREAGYQDLVISAQLGPERSVAEVRAAAGEVRGLEVVDFQLDLDQAGSRVDFRASGAGVLGATLTATGHSQPDERVTRRSWVEGRIENARLDWLDEMLRPNASTHPSGRISADYAFELPGTSWEQIRPLLEGTTRVRVEEGVLRGVNLAASAVEAIRSVPGLSLLLPSNLAQLYPEVFGGNDTPFDTIDSVIEIADGQARSDEIRLRTQYYSVQGGGRVSLEGEADVSVTLTFSERFGKNMLGSGAMMRQLLNPAGLLAVPFRITGRPPDVKTRADPAYVTRMLKGGVVDGIWNGLKGGIDALRPGKRSSESP